MGMVPCDHFILTGSFKPDCLHTNVIAAATENTSSQCPHLGDNLHIVTRLEDGQNQERKDVFLHICLRSRPVSPNVVCLLVSQVVS